MQITACKYRSATNNWCKYFFEHAHFENASSAPIKNIVLSKCQHGSFCRVIRKRIDPILEEKDAENTKKATKVTLKHISRLLARKRIEGSRALDMKS